MAQYWFRPKRFWKWFAAYHPSSWHGWVVSVALLTVLAVRLLQVMELPYSLAEQVLHLAPLTLALAVVFDLLCRSHGEYPWWWEKPGRPTNS